MQSEWFGDTKSMEKHLKMTENNPENDKKRRETRHGRISKFNELTFVHNSLQQKSCNFWNCINMQLSARFGAKGHRFCEIQMAIKRKNEYFFLHRLATVKYIVYLCIQKGFKPKQV